MVLCDAVTVCDRDCTGRRLWLSNNQMTGTIPEWLGSLTDLQ
jgi:hypothetical protein